MDQTDHSRNSENEDSTHANVPPPETSRLGSEFDGLRELYRQAHQPPANHAPKPPPERPLGKADRFEILRYLKSGGMGDVWVAADLHVNRREVCYKVIKKKEEEDREDFEKRVHQFYREPEITDRVKQPGVVPILDVLIDDDERPAYVMELLEGEMLSEVIDRYLKRKRGPKGEPRPTLSLTLALTLRELLGRLIEVAEIVDRAHRLEPGPGIVHADIKPNNVRIDARGATRLIDWGSAHVLGTERDSGTFGSGTRGYFRESTRGAPPTIDRDVYALGATLAAILTGDPEGNLSAEPRALRAIAEKARSLDAYPSASDFAADLKRYLDGDHVEADVDEPLQDRSWRWVNRHRTAAVTTLVLAVAGTVAWGFVQNDRLKGAEERAGIQREAALVSLIERARARARLGNWSEALPDFGQAIADSGPGPRAQGLRVERLPGFLAVNDQVRMREELADLGDGQDLGPLKARVDLARAILFLCDMNTRDAGVASARRALEANGDGALIDSDRAFAQALVQTKPAEALKRLDEAVRLDPLNVNAQNSRLVALLVTGELKRAREEAQRLARILPAATLPPIALTLIELCEGDRAAASAHLDDLAQILGPSRAADVDRLREHCQHFGNLMDLLSKYDPSPPQIADRAKVLAESLWLKVSAARGIPLDLPVPTLGLLASATDRLVEAGGSAPRADGKPRPLTVAQLFRSIEAMAGMVANNELIRGAEAVPKLKALRAEFPEATIPLLEVINLSNSAMRLIMDSKEDEARPILTEIAALCDLTIDAPTLLPRSPMLYKARVMGAVADLSHL
ncbi:MAG: hypothetical protein AB7I30_14285, partial [Isosphaeraceae bacterium]